MHCAYFEVPEYKKLFSNPNALITSFETTQNTTFYGRITAKFHVSNKQKIKTIIRMIWNNLKSETQSEFSFWVANNYSVGCFVHWEKLKFVYNFFNPIVEEEVAVVEVYVSHKNSGARTNNWTSSWGLSY